MSVEGIRLIVNDLITRTEKAVNDVCGLCAETGITFQLTDVVDAVERALPANYPFRSTPDTDRRAVIQDLAHKILTGEMYEDDTSDVDLAPDAPDVQIFLRRDGWVLPDYSDYAECCINAQQPDGPRCTDTAIWKAVRNYPTHQTLTYWCGQHLPAEHRNRPANT